MRILLILLVGFLALPFIASVSLQLYGSALMAKTAKEVNRQIFSVIDKEPVDTGISVFGAKPAGSANYAPGYVAIANIDQFSRHRDIWVSAYVTLNDLAKEGETVPEDADLLQLFIKARSTDYAMQECLMLLQTLANECKVANSQADLQSGAAKIALISFKLAFVQKADFGRVAPEGRYVFSEISEELRPLTSETVSIAGQAELRKSTYQKIANHCAFIRKTQGNCAINKVKFQAFGLNLSSSRFVATSQATFGVLVENNS